MTTDRCPPSPFTGPISAAEDLASVVARVLEETDPANVFAVDQVIAALLAGGAIHEEWGARYHHPVDGDVDTWRDTRAEAEAMIAARARPPRWPHPSSLIRRFVVVTAAEVTR